MLQCSIRGHKFGSIADVETSFRQCGLARFSKDLQMYQDELYREARLIAQGHQLFVAHAVALYKSWTAFFGFKA